MDLRDAGIYDYENLFTGKPTDAHGRSTAGGSVINAQVSRIINIPAYQRPYRWGEENINRLFIDYYDDNDGQYFLGSAVAVEKKQDMHNSRFDIVDGQQRITTLYLLNYLRFILLRERFHLAIEKRLYTRLSPYCTEMRNCYMNMVGKNNEPHFSKLNETIISLDEIKDDDLKYKTIRDSFIKNMCYASPRTTEDETITEIRNQMKEFFRAEQLSLTYSRIRYIELLKYALCVVYIKSTDMSTDVDLMSDKKAETEPEWKYAEPYVNALKALFANVKKQAKESHPNPQDNLATINYCLSVITELLSNLSFCIVVTENEDDAYKLFEVLNDRSLGMQDLELIKNHFYREYCTKSGEQDNSIIDSNIAILEEIWNSSVFEDAGAIESRLISYFAAVYFTSDKDLDNKNDAKYKNDINKSYSDKYYNDANPYTFDCIERDFNVYYAIKLIIRKFKLQAMRLDQNACEAEVDNSVSITYKTMNLLHALKQTSVMAALINIILSSYWHQNEKFNKAIYESYIEDLIHDKGNCDNRFIRIHECSHVLWTASLRGENYAIPREIASSIIGRFGAMIYDDNQIVLSAQNVEELNKEFDKWIRDYRYGYRTDLKVKILFLRLLTWTRSEPAVDGYKAQYVKLLRSSVSYNLNGRDVQLDHLEANNPTPGNPTYFMLDSPDERKKILNHNIGNFMILDAADNNSKDNIPLALAIDKFYQKMKDAWLITDIKDMIKDSQFFDASNNIPREMFFTERTKRLGVYFKKLLNTSLNAQTIEVFFR